MLKVFPVQNYFAWLFVLSDSSNPVRDENYFFTMVVLLNFLMIFQSLAALGKSVGIFRVAFLFVCQVL